MRAGIVQGWQVKGTQELDLTWATSFNPESSTILAVAARAADEPVYSHAKVPPDVFCTYGAAPRMPDVKQLGVALSSAVANNAHA